VVRLFTPLGRSTGREHVLEYVLVGMTVASVPFVLWALARVMAPDYFALPGRRLKTASVVIVCLVATTGFLVGQFNYRFTTCHDYVIAGDDEPADCRPDTTPTPTPTPSAPSTPQASPHAS
jgi:hypothetical protein